MQLIDLLQCYESVCMIREEVIDSGNKASIGGK